MMEVDEWATLIGGPRDGALTALGPTTQAPPDTYWIPLMSVPIYPGTGGFATGSVDGPRVAKYQLIRRFDMQPSRDDRGCLRYKYAEEQQ